MGETGLAHQTVRDNASGDPRFYLAAVQVGGSGVAKLGDEIGWGIGPAKFAGERFVAKRLNLFEFFLPLRKLILGLELQDGGIPFQNGSSEV